MTTDLALVRRLEFAEGAANAAFVEARAAVTPSSGALWLQIGGAYAMFDGPESPLTQTFGLGLDGAVPEGDFLALEHFFLSRGAAVCHEVSPYITADTLRALSDRGYRPIELSTVLVRSTMVEPARDASTVDVRRVDESERDIWARVAGQGWASESAELSTFVEAFGRITSRAAGVHCFVAEVDGRPVRNDSRPLREQTALVLGKIPEHQQTPSRDPPERRAVFLEHYPAPVEAVIRERGSKARQARQPTRHVTAVRLEIRAEAVPRVRAVGRQPSAERLLAPRAVAGLAVVVVVVQAVQADLFQPDTDRPLHVVSKLAAVDARGPAEIGAAPRSALAVGVALYPRFGLRLLGQAHRQPGLQRSIQYATQSGQRAKGKTNE